MFHRLGQPLGGTLGLAPQSASPTQQTLSRRFWAALPIGPGEEEGLQRISRTFLGTLELADLEEGRSFSSTSPTFFGCQPNSQGFRTSSDLPSLF